MAAPFLQCTKEEQYAGISFLVRHGEHSRNSSQNTFTQYGGSCLSQIKFYDWLENYRIGRTSVTVLECHGQRVQTEIFGKRTEESVCVDGRVTVDESVGKYEFSRLLLLTVIHKDLQFMNLAQFSPNIIVAKRNILLRQCRSADG